MRVDIHSHVLPMLDDGANSAQQSLEMLALLKADDVDVVVATPHYYPNEQSIEAFLKTRATSYALLKEAMAADEREFPEIRLGAEVSYVDGLSELSLYRLCIERTGYVLLELPYHTFSETFMNTFADFVESCEYNIILAHIERYYDFNAPESIEKLLKNEVVAQFNCDSVLEFAVRRKFFKLLFSGHIHIMATDTHDNYRRPPRFSRAEKYLRSKFGHRETDRIIKTSELVLENAEISQIAELRLNNF
ncbi:MAG: hypothetical protein FWH05_08400 [Oscillospiraceae bacterium]|nr:hypothetical protein [Oscillospiraceae bacterium]